MRDDMLYLAASGWMVCRRRQAAWKMSGTRHHSHWTSIQILFAGPNMLLWRWNLTLTDKQTDTNELSILCIDYLFKYIHKHNAYVAEHSISKKILPEVVAALTKVNQWCVCEPWTLGHTQRRQLVAAFTDADYRLICEILTFHTHTHSNQLWALNQQSCSSLVKWSTQYHKKPFVVIILYKFFYWLLILTQWYYFTVLQIMASVFIFVLNVFTHGPCRSYSKQTTCNIVALCVWYHKIKQCCTVHVYSLHTTQWVINKLIDSQPLSTTCCQEI